MRVVWTQRPVKLIERGEQASEVKFLDTGSIAAISNDQLDFDEERIVKVRVSKNLTVKPVLSKCLTDYIARNTDKLRADFNKDSDGWWLNTKKGWQASPNSECHTIHAVSVHQLVKDCKHICRCECEECRK